eukprot:CAMPEP_0194133254 /NCGR_PEP_ID=MMETSP0152-20130528/3505_1 /TAXON_ID=1049557 /ORGANISM="Thalassiothrix antarctica, Strain L6-D1" /LENGTH=195 /DNA_ID=CAMNT_0038828537 /DNA_START=51 /DNA_END=638 /DNA_ORIENTATION=+
MTNQSISTTDRKRNNASNTVTNRIRANFLNRLGISHDKAVPSRRSPSRGSLLGDVKIRMEALKFSDDKLSKKKSRSFWFPHLLSGQDYIENDENLQASSLSTTSTSQSSIGSTGPRITFNDEVKVVPIPMRDEYSKRVQDRLWTKPNELNIHVQRNIIEFKAEGWNWRTVLEDENMYRDVSSGELIHPVHVVEYS